MKIKIVEPGWDTYTGPLGLVHFENAVSTSDISRQEALRIGAMLRVVEINEDGEDIGTVNPAHEVLLHQTVAAPVVPESPREAEPALAPAPQPVAEEPAPPAIVKIYSKEELFEIASKEGINGIRKIGEPLGVKNNSIKGLIAEILAAQPKE